MAEKVLMIALSPTMETGTLVKWNKKEGDKVESGDVICEVETDKAAMEYETDMEGILLKIIVNEGEKAEVGEAIAIIGEEGENTEDILAELSKENEEENQETDKKSENSKPGNNLPAKEKSDTNSINETGRIIASPLAKRIADMNNLDISTIKGSGPKGRVVKKDVERLLNEKRVGRNANDIEPEYSVENQVVPVSQKRRIIARRLSESKYSAPHYYLKVSVDMEKIIKARKSLNASQDKKVSMNAFIIKLVAQAIKNHPIINASWQGDMIKVFGSVDIGLAVAQSDGLITPIVRNCVHKGIMEIEEDLNDIIPRAINNNLKPEEYTGATFTISNLGSYGIEEFTAIINPPGSAILAVGEIKRTPVVIGDDEIVIKPLMKITLSCDHRVIDGAVGAEFLKTLKTIIENPIAVLY